MNQKTANKNETISINPIGVIGDQKSGFKLEIEAPYRAGLNKLDQFSHVMVFWWANQHDTEESRSKVVTELPYAEDVTAGVFACRAEYRPNPIAVTISTIIKVDEKNGVVYIDYTDAYEGTPIIDLKPYIPVSDRVKDVKVPDWFSQWPDWFEDAGEFFSKHFCE
ncbi:MAG: SAM-dependent methyltransferase [bacterium]|nr:SAM-dependent methyltransferase [bacterium]